MPGILRATWGADYGVGCPNGQKRLDGIPLTFNWPAGAEVGGAVVPSYRAIYTLPNGRILTVAPLAVADLHDRAKVASDDNMPVGSVR